MAEDWHTHAACRAPDVDQALFYPPPLEVGQNWETAEAKAICAACPVRRPCLSDALDRGERHGVWGGVNMASSDDRRRAEAALAAGDRYSPTRDCEECNRPFIGPLNQRLCGETCRKRRARRRWHEQQAS